jgi:His-Xaa-Ser system radical SAM maturase HxsC
MIPLRGTATATLGSPLQRTVWMLVDGTLPPEPEHACMIAPHTPDGYGLYVQHQTDGAFDHAQILTLPPELDHLGPGDVISVTPDGHRVRVLWRRNSHQNSILLTERCDNYCLMCSQPPKDGDDSWLLDQAHEVIRLLPTDTTDVLYTGGEPTLYGDGLIGLLDHTLTHLPDAQVHLLSNGRRFANDRFAEDYAAVGNDRLMVGIPIYGAEASLHDYVVQADGAFAETVRGILNLAAHGQQVEIRVVIHRQTVPALVDIAEFIARNLPFVDQVALMGLEMMGFARANLGEVWVDPWDYRDEIVEAAELLEAAGIRTLLFNHQLCLLPERLWHLTVPSISDWKNEYAPECTECDVRDRCGGFFHSFKYRTSDHIRAIHLGDAPATVTESPLTLPTGFDAPVALRRRT